MEDDLTTYTKEQAEFWLKYYIDMEETYKERFVHCTLQRKYYQNLLDELDNEG